MIHFNITSTSANVQDLEEKVRRGFENADLVLVQAYGLQFEDNEISRGRSIMPAWYIHIPSLTFSYKQTPPVCSHKVSKAASESCSFAGLYHQNDKDFNKFFRQSFNYFSE